MCEKQLAAEKAVTLIEPNMRVGLGTGSTAAIFIDLLGARNAKENLGLRCASSSVASQTQAKRVGLAVFPLEELAPLDIAVDGADELTEDLALIKGGGGALLREREVAKHAKRFVVIADSSKKVDMLGRFPLPIEVAQDTHEQTAQELEELLQKPPALRQSNGTAFITDNGNYIYDVALERIPAPQELATALESIPAVRAHGLFLGLAQKAFLGYGERVEEISA